MGEQGFFLNLLEHYECMRMSDSMTLLHYAVFLDRRSFASMVLRKAGNASWWCVTHEGQSALHLVARHSTKSKTLSWALGQLPEAGADVLKVLDLPDKMGMRPWALARDVDGLKALMAAGSSKTDINAVDVNGAS